MKKHIPEATRLLIVALLFGIRLSGAAQQPTTDSIATPDNELEGVSVIGYRKINSIAFKKVAPGGIVFTFSCSQAVSKEEFRLAVFTAAAASGRKVRILHQLTQPVDHPINIYHPEGEYLKGLVLYVE